MREFRVSSFEFPVPGVAPGRAARAPRQAAGGLWGTRLLVSAVLAGALCGVAVAQNITGTVTNGTTGKPAGGDEVTLLSLSQGMQEVGSTKSDAQGKFTLKAPADGNMPHMVRVTHGGVNYFPQGGPLMPGATSSQVTVYDTAKQIDGLTQTVEVDRLQATGGQLQVIALFALNNGSNPPRTMDADKTFQVVLPEAAVIEAGMARAPGGQPLSMTPTETGQKGHYAFSFPLKPGETQFQVTYSLPYKGGASLSPKLLGDVQHFVVMTAPGMTFSPANAQRFQPVPNQQGVMVATQAKAGEDLSFKVSGTGQFQGGGEQTAGAPAGGGGAMGGGQAAAGDSRPGGGLGAPIDSNDPLFDYRAVILGIFAVVLVMGGFYVIGRSNNPAPVPATVTMPANEAPVAAPRSRKTVEAAEPSSKPIVASDRSNKLLDAMKDELFQLELERQQGKVSQAEYDKAKAALDETIRRALARKSS